MTNIRIHHDELTRFSDALERMPDRLTAEMVTGVNEMLLLGQRETQERTPTATGLTRNSIIADAPVVTTGGGVEGRWGSAAPHIEPLEEGSRPHMPPIAPIQQWVVQKLGISEPTHARAVAWAVATKIKREGTRGQFMFRDATTAISAAVQRRLGLAVARTIQFMEAQDG
ncbi:MAG: HK97 gp10 family phage protein [Alphaproteobacteria bacterium]|nr:HK97 gp10 family phage protein [Alphaproteobacteria bacterium]